ncbi:MAG: dodecin domain-containing protein [Chloroflexota bacterium]
MHEATGSARTGWDAALKAAVKAARAEIDDPVAVEIARQWVDLGPKGMTTYHVSVKVAYRQALAAPKREKKTKAR